MSEKRFIFYEYDDGTETIEDTEENEYYHFSSELVGLLNEQQATIQSLQKDIIEMSDSHQSYIKMESETKSKVNDIIRTQRIEIRKLSKENEQLRKEHQEMLEKYLLLKLKIGEVLNDE